ncbi:MAG: sterol desaturase family protein [Pseudomonadota bacterium]
MEHETTIRLGVFFGLFAALALWELCAPMRVLRLSRGRRWLTNWGISVLNSGVTVAMKLLLGAAAVMAALDAQAMGWGLFNQLDWPAWAEILMVFLILDFAIWAQHVASHKIPLLWRLHRMHHADRDIDVTTAIRFHPLEIALSMLLKIGLVYALGAPVAAVILFEVVLNGAAMFNHANIKLGRADRWLRLAIVTPDMHRVHHSVHRDEHDTNYGFNLSLWDRAFGTYCATPRDGHREMAIGLAECQSEAPARFGWSLSLPFRRL